MKWPGWRHIASYFADIQVDYRPSAINDDLIVLLSKGRYQLCTANAIYSYEDQYNNFGNIFRDYLMLDKLPGNKVLILGLGLGSVPITLDALNPGVWHFTAVEIDDAVCELATIYGYPKIISPIDTHIMDAVYFVDQCREQFDLICLDLFVDDVIPDDCKSTTFLASLKKLLSPGGVIIANTLAYSEDHQKNSMSFYNEAFRPIFPESTLIHTHLNYMLVSDKKLVRSPNKG